MLRNLLLILVAVLMVGCGTTPRRTAPVAAIAQAPAAVLALPLREERPGWLLREEAGWCAAHWASFGGGSGDAATLAVHVARFRDAGTAVTGAARLTPAYLTTLVRERMARPPHPVSPVVTFAEGTALLYEYGGQAPPSAMGTAAGALPVALAVLRSGPVVALLESIGLTPSQGEAVREALRDAARTQAGGDC